MFLLSVLCCWVLARPKAPLPAIIQTYNSKTPLKNTLIYVYGQYAFSSSGVTHTWLPPGCYTDLVAFENSEVSWSVSQWRSRSPLDPYPSRRSLRVSSIRILSSSTSRTKISLTVASRFYLRVFSLQRQCLSVLVCVQWCLSSPFSKRNWLCRPKCRKLVS